MSDPLNTASSNLYDFLSPLPPTTIPTHISPLERRRHADKTRRSSTFARLTSFDDECEVQNHKTKLPARGHRSTEPRNAQRHRAHRSLSPKRSTATTATKATGVAGAPFRAFNKSQSSVLSAASLALFDHSTAGSDSGSSTCSLGSASETNSTTSSTPLITEPLSTIPLLPSNPPPATPLTLLFTHLLPHLTWFLLFLLLLLPQSYRLHLVLLYTLPISSPPPTTFSPLHRLTSWYNAYLSKHLHYKIHNPNPTKKRVIYACHPHGKYPMPIFPALRSDGGLKDVFVAQSSVGKWVATVGYVTWLSGRVIDVTRREIVRRLGEGSVAMFPGGIREMVECDVWDGMGVRPDVKLVKHGGFLSVAKESGVGVVPVFWYGMQDGWRSGGRWWDEGWYKRVGCCAPTWWPNGVWGVVGVVGDEIDTSLHSLEDLEVVYWNALKDLYEKYRDVVGGDRYKDRNLAFIEVKKKSGPGAKTSQSAPHSAAAAKKSTRPAAAAGSLAHNITSLMSLLFLSTILAIGWYTGTYWQFSTWSVYKNVPPVLVVHLAACACWAGGAGVLMVLKYRQLGKWHRRIGAVSTIASLAMSWSAVHLSLVGVTQAGRGAELGAELGFLTRLGAVHAVNACFHSICNFHIAFVTIYLAIYGVSAVALYNHRDEHHRILRILHVLIGISLVPRFSAAWFRWVGGCWWSDETSFSMACGVQVLWQVGQIVHSHKNKSKMVTRDHVKWCIKSVIVRCNVKAVKLGGLMVVAGVAMGPRVHHGVTSLATAASLLAAALGFLDARGDFKYDVGLATLRSQMDTHAATVDHKVGGAHVEVAGLEWDMDVTELGEREMDALFGKAFAQLGLSSAFNVAPATLLNFVGAVRAGYADVPYHNFGHAVDVVHVTYLLVNECDGGVFLDDASKLALFVSALVHDVGHNGYTNGFNTKVGSELAITYNDASVQENFSAASLFRIVKKGSGVDNCNVFEGIKGATMLNLVKNYCIEMILNTDAAKHFELLALFREGLEKKKMGRSLLGSMLLHLADVSNPCKQPMVAAKWAFAVQEEFFRQGDKERELGMDVSPFMSKDDENLPKMQNKFTEFFVAPMLDMMSEFLPKVDVVFGPPLRVNTAFWKELEADGVLTMAQISHKYGVARRGGAASRRRSVLRKASIAEEKREKEKEKEAAACLSELEKQVRREKDEGGIDRRVAEHVGDEEIIPGIPRRRKISVGFGFGGIPG